MAEMARSLCTALNTGIRGGINHFRTGTRYDLKQSQAGLKSVHGKPEVPLLIGLLSTQIFKSKHSVLFVTRSKTNIIMGSVSGVLLSLTVGHFSPWTSVGIGPFETIDDTYLIYVTCHDFRQCVLECRNVGGFHLNLETPGEKKDLN